MRPAGGCALWVHEGALLVHVDLNQSRWLGAPNKTKQRPVRSLLLWTLTEPYVPKRSRVAERYRTVKFTSKERLGWIHQHTALKLKLHPANDAHGHPRRRERRRSQCGKRAREQERLPRARARRP